MNKIILLDSGPLGLVSNPLRSPLADACSQWVETQLLNGETVVISEVADYEVRRELLRAGKTRSVERLDELQVSLDYLPITTPAMRKAAELWAQARQIGKQTAADASLDADMILAAQALLLIEDGDEVVVATSNPKHLSIPNIFRSSSPPPAGKTSLETLLRAFEVLPLSPSFFTILAVNPKQSGNTSALSKTKRAEEARGYKHGTRDYLITYGSVILSGIFKFDSPAAAAAFERSPAFQRRERCNLDPPVARATIEWRFSGTKRTVVVSRGEIVRRLRRSTDATMADYRALPGVETPG